MRRPSAVARWVSRLNESFAPKFEPTLASAQARIAAVRPAVCARTRNSLDGAVSQLSPCITHGHVSLADVLAGVAARHALDVQHKFVYELGWRAYFRHVWPWDKRRWHFVGSRMAELAAQRWHGDAGAIGAALKRARRLRSIGEPHLAPWLARWAECGAAPALFPPVDRRCDSFSQWWSRASRGLDSAADLLAVNEVPAW